MLFTDRFLRNTCTFLAGLVLTNTALAYSAETNFWKEREKSIQVAALLPTAEITSLKSQTLNSKQASSASSLKSISSLEFETCHLEFLSHLPANLGTLRKITKSRTSASRTLVHIQDVHLNQEAQNNIGKTVQALIASGRVDLIALEGAFAPIDLQTFRQFEDKEALRMASDYLLRENRISGTVHAGLVSPEKIPAIVGIDDKAHYDANDKWKTQCMGKDYDERDMKALEKEKAAAAAAAPAASAAK
jgi:hypothetical protein